ncbi:MAG: protein translocase subunit SecD [Thermoanaerobaculia bacterium]
MKSGLLWRGLLILAVAVLSILAAYPLEDSIHLGLDLRGGIHLVLRVETEDAVRSETDKDMDRVVQEMRDLGIDAAAGTRTGETAFTVRGVPPERDGDIDDVVENFLGAQAWTWNREGEQLSFRMTEANHNQIRDQAVRQALETIRNRIDAFGVSEPVIQRAQQDNRIVVQLPGVDDPERVKALIKNTAFLEFKLVDFPSGGSSSSSREEILQHYQGRLPEDIEILTQTIRNEQKEPVGESYYAVRKSNVITGRDLKNARPGLGQFNQPVVNFFLTPEGGDLFAEATGNNVGKGLAIVLDGQVVSAPNIRSRIGDQGLIEGGFTQQEVEDLSTVLRSGALPAGITYLEERTVGPSLGHDSIQRGLRAGLLGLGLVVLSMLLVYKLSGFNAITALALNIIIVFGALAYFGATLTLPGIAGIVLTVGMAVDANVLVFERIKEELRRGRTVKSSIDAGFGKALSSIMDANVTTLIAALFLFQFGTGPIRGFAVTLSIGILASLFTAIFVSRWIFDLLLSRKNRVERLSI